MMSNGLEIFGYQGNGSSDKIIGLVKYGHLSYAGVDKVSNGFFFLCILQITDLVVTSIIFTIKVLVNPFHATAFSDVFLRYRKKSAA